MLRSYTSNNPTDWAKGLSAVEIAYNDSVRNASTGFTLTTCAQEPSHSSTRSCKPYVSAQHSGRESSGIHVETDEPGYSLRLVMQ
jgi:hypothetical protein